MTFDEGEQMPRGPVARRTDYSTASKSGLSYLLSRWMYTGDEGFRVSPGADGLFDVVSYSVSGVQSLGKRWRGLTEDAAHENAARLARTTPHPKET
jgi:hypothetical protein